MNPRHILGLLILGALALAVSGLAGGSEAASARRLPACPQTWPETTGWHGDWYVIVDQDSNGNKHGRAYRADARYRQGYVPAAPHETCIVRIRDNPSVTQLSFREDRDQEDRDRTRQTTVAGTGASGNQGGAGPETLTPEPSDPATYSVSPAAMVIEGGSAALTITLSEAAPADGVTFTVTPGYDGDASAVADDVGSIATPVIVPTGDTTLTITIPTVDDAVDEDDEIFMVTVAGGDGWTESGDGRGTATVTITDDDTSGVTVNAANPVRVNEEATATYTVVLNSRPTADVTVTAVSDDIGAVTVHPASHTFSPSQWNQAKTFTVRGVADDDTNDESVVIGHQATSADAKYAATPVSSVRVAVSDTTSQSQQGSGGGQSTPTPTPEPTDPSTYSVSSDAMVIEGGSAALTITLSEAAPADGVAFTVTPGYDGDATAEADDVGSIATPVIVPTGDTTLAITIPTVDDDVDEGVETFTIIIATAATGWVKASDGGDTAVVTIVDNDTAGITVTAAQPLAVSEGGSATYTVVLNSRPTADVTITAVSDDVGAATVRPASHTFAPSQWNQAKTFTVRGVSDDDTNDERVGISHRVTSADGKYAGALVSSARVAVSDPSTYSVSPFAMVVEGGSATLTITLSEAAPADGLAFTVTPGYDGDATAEADDVGSIATPVTVPTGDTTLAITIPTVSDDVDEGVETFTIIIATAATGWVKASDGGDTAVVTIVDNDTAGITVTAAQPLAVSEGGSATYTVVLNSRPTADVTITAVSDDVGAATVRPASHTFAPSQWNQAKTFTVRGVSDDDTDDERVGIGHRVTSADAKYAGALVSSVRVAVSDPSTYSVSPFAMVVEGGSAALTITLSEAAPADGVAFTVTPGYDGDASAAAGDVGSIATPVTVPTGDTTLAITIPTVSDDVDEGVETFTVVIATTATGWVKTGDGEDTAVVTIVDNDTAGITVTAARPLAVSEGGSATYTVVLNSRPTADVTITAVSDDVGAATVDPASHVFSPSQWNQAKTFTVRGVSDDDTNDESVVISHRVTSADAKYAGALVSSVRVAVSDTTPTPTPTPTPEPAQEPDPPGSGNSCPSDYEHTHDGDKHWHQWSIDHASGQCFHSVGHHGVGYHEH